MMSEAERIAEGLTEAQRGLLCGILWSAHDPANPRFKRGLACDITYSPSVQRALVAKGLADRTTNGARTAWFYLTPLGLEVRKLLEASK